MINLQSQVAGQNSDQLLSQANSEAFTKGTEKQDSGESFFSLMTEFLGLNVDQETKEKQGTKIKSTVFDSFDELMGEKTESEIKLDLINLEKGGKERATESKAKIQTIDLPDELLIQLGNLIQRASGQDGLEGIGKVVNANPVQVVEGGESQVTKSSTIEDSLKALNKLLDGLQIKRSGEKFVLTIPDSNTELKAEKKENIQNQLSKIIRQLPGQVEQNSLKQLVAGITPKTDVEVSLSADSKQVAKTIKEGSLSTHHFPKNRLGFMESGDAPQGKALENASNGNQKTDTQQTQKLTLRNVIQQFSEEVGINTEKNNQSQAGTQRLSSESKESVLFSNLKEKSGLLIKQLTSEPDRKLQTDLDLSKSLPDENSKQEGELTSRKLEAQNSKNSSPSKFVDKSQAKPIQVLSISEIKKDETTFKPLVKIETQNGNLDFEFQSQADTDSGDSEEGKSFLKLNNTSFTQLTKNSGRREFSTQMVKQLQKQADQSGLGTAKNWSQHRFVLESGDSVNVAVRQSEGVMQLQLGAGNSELNKILIQHINEIRQHLQEQMNIDIDLQLQQFGDQQADFNDNGQNSENGKEAPNDGTSTSMQHVETEVDGSKTQTRYLGFNQNEWTA